MTAKPLYCELRDKTNTAVFVLIVERTNLRNFMELNDVKRGVMHAYIIDGSKGYSKKEYCFII